MLGESRIQEILKAAGEVALAKAGFTLEARIHAFGEEARRLAREPDGVRCAACGLEKQPVDIALAGMCGECTRTALGKHGPEELMGLHSVYAHSQAKD